VWTIWHSQISLCTASKILTTDSNTKYGEIFTWVYEQRKRMSLKSHLNFVNNLFDCSPANFTYVIIFFTVNNTICNYKLKQFLILYSWELCKLQITLSEFWVSLYLLVLTRFHFMLLCNLLISFILIWNLKFMVIQVWLDLT